MLKRIAIFALILALVYVSLGIAFHIGWKAAADACRTARIAQGEFVEPNEILGGAIGLAFSVTFWPVYAAANMRLDGTPFATPCTH